ncbi:MAG: hypothetical protein WAV38_21280 [Xanthobacteraceae bacterium]
MTFTVISNSFKDGDYLASDFILSANFGFGCAGGNKSPHLKWGCAPCGGWRPDELPPPHGHGLGPPKLRITG